MQGVYKVKEGVRFPSGHFDHHDVVNDDQMRLTKSPVFDHGRLGAVLGFQYRHQVVHGPKISPVSPENGVVAQSPGQHGFTDSMGSHDHQVKDLVQPGEFFELSQFGWRHALHLGTVEQVQVILQG